MYTLERGMRNKESSYNCPFCAGVVGDEMRVYVYVHVLFMQIWEKNTVGYRRKGLKFSFSYTIAPLSQ